VGDECTWRGYRIKVIEVQRPGHVRALFSALRGSVADSDTPPEQPSGKRENK